MIKINRFDIYDGKYLREAMLAVESWGNRKDYEGCLPSVHLASNMNGWLAEELFKETFPQFEYIDAEDHCYLSELNPYEFRKGKPDFKHKDDSTWEVEVKAYNTMETIYLKIEKWKQWDKELHNAASIMILNWQDKKWYQLFPDDNWKLIYVADTKFPKWYKGKCYFAL